jgi:hypothetical protein
MPLIKGQTYTWHQLLKQTGAGRSPPYYLLHAGRRVVASCLTPDLNPDAPTVILAGDAPQRREYADLFCAQGGAIPVCMKSADRWLCCGYFKLQRFSTDPAEIEAHSARAKRTDVYKILFLEEVPAPATPA